MTDFIHHHEGTIDVGAAPLPRSYGNTSGLDKADAATLKALGWLPVTYQNESYEPNTQTRSGPTGCNAGDSIDPDADSVTGTYTVSDRVPTVQDVRDEMERRADLGIVVGGTRIRLDDRSQIRILGTAELSTDDYPFSFTTQAGDIVTLANASVAAAIRSASVLYIRGLLDASSGLQSDLPATMTALKEHEDWPDDGSGS